MLGTYRSQPWEGNHLVHPYLPANLSVPREYSGRTVLVQGLSIKSDVVITGIVDAEDSLALWSTYGFLRIIMAEHRFAYLGFSLLLSCLWCGWGHNAQAQPTRLDDSLTRLNRAVCLEQWNEAIALASGVIALPEISSIYRQEMLSFRRQLQTWRVSPVSPIMQANCDRTLSLFLTLSEPEPPEAQPLDWNRALATLRASRPIIDLDDDYEPAVIPAEFLANSPEVLTDGVTPIDTADGFNVVGGSINRGATVHSFLARSGDRVSLEVDVTRSRIGGEPQLFLFDQQGQLISQSSIDAPQISVQNVAIPKTDVYFAVVSPQGTAPVLDTQGSIVGWQVTDNSSFDYTLTLTGVTPSQTLLP